MPEINVSANNTLFLTTPIRVDNKKIVPFYGSVEDSDTYFYYHVEYNDWMCFERDDKLRGIAQATRIIDRLNFIGYKTDSTQTLEFPRNDETVIPVAIEQATYEVALKLLQGVRPDIEADNLSVTVQSFAGISRSEYDRSFVPPYTKAGIPSQTAWNLIYPFLRNSGELKLLRG